MRSFHHGVSAVNAHRDILYYPEKRPGFVAWTTCFEYGNGEIGLSFKETKRCHNANFTPPKLEFGEAVGAPVSYCSVECGSENEESYRVYMKTADNGKTFIETGRCQLEEGSFCNAGFADGKIIGFDVPRINEKGTGWCEYIDVRESVDGGSTWRRTAKLLEGTAPYLWRARRLQDGSIILLASLYGTPWGGEHIRTTRNTMLPGESYLNKIQTFFITTKDGVTFSGPHYILPGVGAHEFDVVEREDGSLLFIAGDVQATPVARQTVYKQGAGYINGTIYGIRRGAPSILSTNPQGGFVPETIVMLKSGLLVGARRNKPYSCSNDFGENWYEIDGLSSSLYQPYMLEMPNGTIANFGHFGGDAAFGQEDMYVGVDFFEVNNELALPCELALSRCRDESDSHYENKFVATLLSDKQPVQGEEVTFRFTPVWNIDGTVNIAKQDEAPIIQKAVTDINGNAYIAAKEFDNIPDIHYYYNVDVIYRPQSEGKYRACDGPMFCVAALTPYRKNRYPYHAYFAEGTLYLSPYLLQKYPSCIEKISQNCGSGELAVDVDDGLKNELLALRVLIQKNGKINWYVSIHNERVLDKVLPMAEGDYYV